MTDQTALENDRADNRLETLVAAHLRTVGVADADRQARDFVTLVRAGRENTSPHNDAQLWAATSIELGAALPADRREIVARQVIAILRRHREPNRRTWAPGDALPSPPPATMADLDGYVWVHQKAGHGCYRMNAAGRRRLAGSSSDYQGVRVWPFLLDAEGPFTEVTK